VDLYAIASGYSLRRALALEHRVLSRNLVLCAKLIAALWLATGQVVYLRADPVPFFGLTLPFTHARIWPQAMVLVQLFAILTILCSPFVRAGCGLLGGAIALLCAIDQPLFSNNRAFCAALLGMIALSEGGTALPRAQVALVYGCAAVDKLLEPAWRSGLFLRTFSANLCRVGELWSPGFSPGTPLPLTCALSEQLSLRPLLAAGCGAALIGTELLLALGYARDARFTAPLAVCFHCLLFVATGSTFGMFFYAGLAAAALVIDLKRAPAPLDRAWPYFAVGAVLAGPWVRPHYAALLALATLAYAGYARYAQRDQVAEDGRELNP
jgi:hypothetical protein